MPTHPGAPQPCQRVLKLSCKQKRSCVLSEQLAAEGVGGRASGEEILQARSKPTTNSESKALRPAPHHSAGLQV